MSDRPTRPRVLLLQQAIYPYRRPLFEELQKSVDLTVLFCLRAKPFRVWDTSEMLDDPPFRARVLPHARLGPLVFNRNLLGELRSGRFDVVAIGTIDLVTLPQVALLLVARPFLRFRLVVVEEFFPTKWYVSTRPVVARVAMSTRRLVYRFADSFVAWNLNARDFLVSNGIEEGRIFSGPQAHPAPAAQPPHTKDAGAGRELATIAYLRPMKGLDLLIRAFKRLPGDVTLSIAGSGELETELRREAGGDERIHFLGHVDDAGKTELLSRAYAFVLPTLFDPWALVVNEALAQNVPVVVSDAAGASTHLDGGGIVVPAGDEDALHRALVELLEDPGRRDAMAREAAHVVAAWTYETQAASLLDAIRGGGECVVCGGTVDVRNEIGTCRACGVTYSASSAAVEVDATTVFDSPARDRVFDLVERRLRARLGGPGTLLDVGCSSGRFLRLAEERGWRTTGIDANEAAVAEARRAGLDARLQRIEDTPRLPNGFDAIVLMNTLEYFEDPVAATRRAFELLRDGGVVAVEMPNGTYHRWQTRVGRLLGVPAARLLIVGPTVTRRLFLFTPRALRRLLERAGFTAVEIAPSQPREHNDARFLRRGIFGAGKAAFAATRGRVIATPAMVAVASKPGGRRRDGPPAA